MVADLAAALENESGVTNEKAASLQSAAAGAAHTAALPDCPRSWRRYCRKSSTSVCINFMPLAITRVIKIFLDVIKINTVCCFEDKRALFNAK